MLKNSNFWWGVTAVVVGLLIMFPPVGFAVSFWVTVGTIAAAVVPVGIAQATGSFKRAGKRAIQG